MSLLRRSRAVLFAIPAMFSLASLPSFVRAAQDDSGQHKHTMKMPQNMRELMSMDPEHCMQMMDQKNKGYVTKEEFMKFQERLWSNMDKNRDKRVDKSEFGWATQGGG
jgi:hypothetical protein